MDRRCPGFLLIIFAVVPLLVLSGCVGKSTNNSEGGGVQTVTLSPTNTVSLELGKTQTFSGTARNSRGGSVFTTIHFTPGCTNQVPCAPISISNNGLACAGTWDSLSNPVVCTPGVAGVASVTAEAEGVSSAPTTVYIHQHIQNIQVAPVGVPTANCFSQDVTWNYQATAFGAQGVDITNTVGPINWSFTTGNVLTVDSIKDLPNNQVQVTAKNPGITQLFASVSGTTSSAVDYTSCLVKSIMLQVQGGSGNSPSINAGGTKTIVATAVDTLDVTLSKPPLTWSTSNPEIATVSTSGVVTARQTAGAADISASCTPPSCNIGILPGLPVYSSGGTLTNGQSAFGVIVAQVTQPKPPTATAWSTTTDCGTNFNCTSAMFPVTAGTNPVGSAVFVPFTPNSFLFIPAGTRAYLGSDKGLMFVDVGAQSPAVNTVSQATTPCNVAVCGKVLAISADGNRVVVSDTTTQPNQVYIFDAAHATTPPVDLLIDGASAAAFSPDQMKIFITGVTKDQDGNLRNTLNVYSTVDALQTATLSHPVAPSNFLPATDIGFSADGSFSYISGASQPTQVTANFISAYSTCDPISGSNAMDFGFVTLGDIPQRIFPLPNIREDHILINSKTTPEHSVITQNLLALEPPNLQLLTAQFTRDVLDDSGQFTCNGAQPQTGQTVPVFWSNPPFRGFSAGPSFNLGQGIFTPLLVQVIGDGSQVIVVAKNIPAVLIFDVNAGTTTAIPLANNASPLAASATLDGTQVFVAACDADHVNPNTCGSVHIVNTQSGGDLQQAVYTNVNTNDNMCNNLPGTTCLPDLIAVRPQ
jgi:hypothetical protein